MYNSRLCPRNAMTCASTKVVQKGTVIALQLKELYKCVVCRTNIRMWVVGHTRTSNKMYNMLPGKRMATATVRPISFCHSHSTYDVRRTLMFSTSVRNRHCKRELHRRRKYTTISTFNGHTSAEVVVGPLLQLFLVDVVNAVFSVVELMTITQVPWCFWTCAM